GLGRPGLGLGYLYAGDRAIAAAVGAEVGIWNLSAEAEWFLEELPRFKTAYEASLLATGRDRDTFRDQLLSLPLVAEVYPSGGNVLPARPPSPPPPAAARVARRLA